MDNAKFLDDFGFHFDDNGVLRTIDGGQKFKFEEKLRDQRFNQLRYEALGEAVTREIYNLLESECDLKRQDIPLDAKSGEPVGFFFHSADLPTNSDKLMVIINGSGEVRAGQWSRRLIINESLEMGSQIPYIQRARADGYAVVVLNTNQNSQKTTDGREQPIRHSSSPSTHAQYVWEKFITGCPAQCIAIVAHSAGGYVTLKLAEFFPTEFCQRVFAVALTDSPIRISGKLEVSVRRHLVKVAKNWRCSGEALGTSLDRDFASNEISSISAGTRVHEESSAVAIASVFQFFRKRYRQKTQSCQL